MSSFVERMLRSADVLFSYSFGWLDWRSLLILVGYYLRFRQIIDRVAISMFYPDNTTFHVLVPLADYMISAILLSSTIMYCHTLLDPGLLLFLDFRGSHSFCSLFDLVIRGCSFQGEQRSIFYLSTLPLWQQTAAKHNFNISATFILYTVYSLIFLFISCFLPTFLVSPTGRSAIHVRR